jgi:hypothetical protein
MFGNGCRTNPAALSELTKIGDYPCEIEWMDNSENEKRITIG